MKKLWFKAKRYGWGWYPARWPGWVVIFAYVFTVVKIFQHFDAASHSASDTLRPFIITLIPLTLILIIICYLTGEPPRWRWGGK